MKALRLTLFLSLCLSGFSFDKLNSYKLLKTLPAESWQLIEASRLKYLRKDTTDFIFDSKYQIYYAFHQDKFYYSYKAQGQRWQDLASLPTSFKTIGADKKYQALVEAFKSFKEPIDLQSTQSSLADLNNTFSSNNLSFYNREQINPLTQSFYGQEFQIFKNPQFLYREWQNRLKGFEQQRRPLFYQNDRDLNRNRKYDKQGDSLKRYYYDNLRRTQTQSRYASPFSRSRR